MRMPRRCAIGDHAHRLARCVGRVIEYLDVEHGGESAQALGADAQRVCRVIDLDTKLLEPVFGSALLELMHVDGLHQRFLREHHRFFRAAPDADAQHSRRTPSCAHGRQRFDHPIDYRIRRIEHHEF